MVAATARQRWLLVLNLELQEHHVLGFRNSIDFHDAGTSFDRPN
jgi:hypothetical protein